MIVKFNDTNYSQMDKCVKCMNGIKQTKVCRIELKVKNKFALFRQVSLFQPIVSKYIPAKRIFCEKRPCAIKGVW